MYAYIVGMGLSIHRIVVVVGVVVFNGSLYSCINRFDLDFLNSSLFDHFFILAVLFVPANTNFAGIQILMFVCNATH